MSHEFTKLIDLAAERIGGKALSVSDDFFAEKENLIKPGRGIFIEDKYTDRGKWMDGWESRRKRTEGHDWCVLRLGSSGIIRGVDIDTNHFLGNHPPHASLEACEIDGDDVPENQAWTEILSKVSLEPGSQNLFDIKSDKRWTHVRLNIFPDGGVARLKVYGEVTPDWDQYLEDELVDLASVKNGGLVLHCNDMFFSDKDNLIMPGRGVNMGDGWETKRKREPGHDWVILQLGRAGDVKEIEVDTCHFKGNFPDMCSIEYCSAEGASIETLMSPETKWESLLPKSKLEAHKQHFYKEEIAQNSNVTHVRLNIFPDGGVSRLRILGTIK
jgi:allantoicase